MFHWLRDSYGYDIHEVPEMLKLEGQQVNKFAVYHPNACEEMCAPLFTPTWKDKTVMAAAGKEWMDEKDLPLYLKSQLEAIMARGKTEPGEKTMLDPLSEARLAVERAQKAGLAGEELLQALKEGAKAGMLATADMPARKGRACYRPDKGVGHLDPGAVTMEYQLRAFADKLLNRGKS